MGARREGLSLQRVAITLGALVLGLTLFATQLKADVDSAPHSIQRMETLWMLTYVNADGVETIAQTRSPTGETFPLMAIDQGRLESIITLGKQISAANKVKLTLVEFSHRSDVGEIKP
jgi:hypothetical protein